MNRSLKAILIIALFLSCNQQSPNSPDQKAAVFSKLPYAENALEPVISANTISFHYGKHFKTYVDNCNNLVKGTALEKMTLDQIVLATAGKSDQVSIFNNAAQAWNHAFYWQSLRPASDATIPDTLKALIDKSFGSVDSFKSALSQAAVSQFGSGWAWLVKDGDNLKVIKTANADNPLPQGLIPLLTVDVWEHAYYLDYQNLRTNYVNELINKILNWDFAVKNLSVTYAYNIDNQNRGAGYVKTIFNKIQNWGFVVKILSPRSPAKTETK